MTVRIRVSVWIRVRVRVGVGVWVVRVRIRVRSAPGHLSCPRQIGSPALAPALCYPTPSMGRIKRVKTRHKQGQESNKGAKERGWGLQKG